MDNGTQMNLRAMSVVLFFSSFASSSSMPDTVPVAKYSSICIHSTQLRAWSGSRIAAIQRSPKSDRARLRDGALADAGKLGELLAGSDLGGVGRDDACRFLQCTDAVRVPSCTVSAVSEMHVSRMFPYTSSQGSEASQEEGLSSQLPLLVWKNNVCFEDSQACGVHLGPTGQLPGPGSNWPWRRSLHWTPWEPRWGSSWQALCMPRAVSVTLI